MRLQEQRHEQVLDPAHIMADLVVAARGKAGACLGRVLQPIERALARHRRAGPPPRLQLASQNRHDGIVAQLIVVVEILVAERQAEHALADQRGDRVLDLLGITRITEAGGKAIDQTDRRVRRPQQQCTGIRRDQPAVERTHNPTPVNGSEVQRTLATLCRHRGTPLLRVSAFSQKNFR
jgi:predicted nucleic acid-binding protein